MPKRMYNCDGLVVVRDDCISAMERIDSGSIDLTVTSPPYDNLRDYEGIVWNEGVWKQVIKELYRVTKVGGVVVWVVGDATINGSETGTSFKQALWAIECGFCLHDTMIYEKASLTFPDTNRYYQSFEYMFIWSKGPRKVCNQIRDRKNLTAGDKVHSTIRLPDGSVKPKSCIGNIIKEFGVRFNIWRITHTDTKARKLHPATFPYSLAHDHIISWSNEGDIVLDPFMGSGTTLLAALRTGRRGIGIEISKNYCLKAIERLEEG